MLKHLVADFIEDSNAAKTREEAFLLYQKALAKFGLDSAVYTFVTDHSSINHKAGHAIQCNYPEHWMKHYNSSGYVSDDPVICEVLKTPAPFTWDSLKQAKDLTPLQRRILDEAEESGLYHGVGIVLYGQNDEVAGVGLASTIKHPDINLDRTTLSWLRLLTEQFHLVYRLLSQQNSGNELAIPSLTKREREILKWWVAGKTAYEVSIILNCSQPTVNFHIRNIYEKLGANSKAAAIAKAIRLGILIS